MTELTFDNYGIKFLYEDFQKAPSLIPTITQLFTPENYPGNELLNTAGLSKGDSKESFWPCANQMIDGAISPRLQLVIEKGVYLINNITSEPFPGLYKRNVYAKGFDPSLHDDYYQNQTRHFGKASSFYDISLSNYNNSASARKNIATIQWLDGCPVFV